MERKEQRVAIGVGAFHNPPRAKYSEETKKLIKLLMEESKVSMMQRKSIQKVIDNGESLPSQNLKTTSLQKKGIEPQVMFPTVWKRRSQDMIIDSGAYEREQYRRTTPLTNKEKEKRHLACIMAYGKDMPPTPREPRILHKERKGTLNDFDPLQELVEGVKERMEFLKDMESLGLGKKYKPIIYQEIAQKIRLIEAIDKQKSAEIGHEVQIFKNDRPPPKPFPLGEWDD